MMRLCRACLLVAFIPFHRWRHGLGFAGEKPGTFEVARARRLAADLEWGARRLPFSTKCLPRAMALSWMLRNKTISHSVIVAVRPPELRESPDALHAWVEVAGQAILGDLPGPWIETARLSGK